MTTIKEVSIELASLAKDHGAQVIKSGCCVWCTHPIVEGQETSNATSIPFHVRCYAEFQRVRTAVSFDLATRHATAENIPASKV